MPGLPKLLERVPDRRWWIGAAWTLIALLGACGLCIGVALALRGALLLPFAFLGFLMGPKQSLGFADFAPEIGGWFVLMLASAGAFYLAGRRALAYYRSTRAPQQSSERWSSIAAGVLSALLIAQLVARDSFETVTPQMQADATPLPYGEDDRRELLDRWLPAARDGDGYAQFVVGEVFRNGLMGETARPAIARRWLEKGAAQGDVDARLSLLTAQRTGRLGFVQDFKVVTKVEALASTQAGWRRAAIELMLAYNPPVVVGRGPPRSSERDRWMNAWLEKAALDGSHFAAFTLARSLELKRSDADIAEPDHAGAAHWFAFAGADFEVARLQRTQGAALRAAALASTTAPVPLPERPSSPVDGDLLGKLERRSTLVAAREAGRVVTMETDDAYAHFVIHAEAKRDYLRLGDTAMQSTPPTPMSGDRRLAAMYYLLAARDGHAEARDRLRAMGLPSR